MKVHDPGPETPTPRGLARRPVTSGVRARAPAGTGGAPRPWRRARPDSRAPGGSVPLGRRTRIPARPPRLAPQENGAEGRLLPNNSAVHRRNNASGGPRGRGQGTGKPERPARLSGCSCARARAPGEPESRCERDLRGQGGKGARPGVPRGSPHEARRGRRAARGWERPEPPGRRAGAMNRAFSQCVAGPGGREPESRIRGPARPQSACPVTQGRGPLAALRPRVPRPSRHSAPPRRGPCPAPALGSRGPSHCDTAAWAGPAPPQLGPSGRQHSPASPGCPQGSGDVSARSLGPGPEKPRPAKVWLRPSAARAAPPGAACDTAPASASSPARPPALLPPPPPAPRNLRPLAFPARLPALPASPAPATAGEAVGEGRNAPPSASGEGEPGNRRRHRPARPRRGRGPETSRPPAAAGDLAGPLRRPRSRGAIYLRAAAPAPAPSRPARRTGSAAGFCSRPHRRATSRGRVPATSDLSSGLTLGGGLRVREKLPEGEGLPPPLRAHSPSWQGTQLHPAMCLRSGGQTPAEWSNPETRRNGPGSESRAGP